ncbi:hypothetical protein COLO4_04342 [Corchorus olitorius]|uniref:Uncharacterized protein n=1 Tax=Corchorus olitorius TaxID=93759 RepID=A0A1R3KUC4_9ROSI|nr:hypothetical protein COLO4_04342 [Corchorus olitorius]
MVIVGAQKLQIARSRRPKPDSNFGFPELSQKSCRSTLTQSLETISDRETSTSDLKPKRKAPSPGGGC